MMRAVIPRALFSATLPPTVVAAVRLYDSPVRTALCWLNPDKPALTEALRLPSGGDIGYDGLVWHDGLLWISYFMVQEFVAWLAALDLPHSACFFRAFA